MRQFSLAKNGCRYCLRGMVHFEVEHQGQRYERYKACTCEAGDRVAKHMLTMAKLKGMNLSEYDVRAQVGEPEPQPF